jgi:hypothetical protein
MALEKINSTEILHQYLYAALQLEHATIPAYMTALYSIHPNTNADASRAIRVVLVEEMLHLTLAANILNAVGGEPDLTRPDFVPQFPTVLPDGEQDFEVSIQGFSKETIEMFMRIERPAHSPVDSDRFLQREKSRIALLPTVRADDATDLHFYSIGEFYAEIGRGLEYLEKEMSSKGEELFTGDPARQITPDYYYSGGGEVVPVVDLESANEAIRLVSEQGEGFGGAIFDYEDELAHFYRFEQILLGRFYQKGDKPGKPSGPPLDVDWSAVYPIKINARLGDYAQGSELHTAALEFNAAYQEILQRITLAYTGQPELLIDAVGDMFRIKELSLQLMRNSIPGSDGQHAAPVYKLADGEA